MELSKNFTLEELIVTATHEPNMPGKTEQENLVALVNNVLQPARDMLGIPIRVNSGYRSAAVNKAIGGVINSQHCKGEAADIDCADNADLFQIIRKHLPFDQLIWEGGDEHQPGWIHVSYCTTRINRQQVLRMNLIDGKKVYEPFV